MKFIHTADWHLGKLVHGVYMTGHQREVLDQFIEVVAEEQPDAVVIAGDMYDRSVPPIDAVNLLDDVLYRLNVELKTPIISIAGNHDSADRLSFGSSWYRQSQFYLSGRLTGDIRPIHINGVNFYLVPFAEPGVIKEVLADSSIHTHHDAMKALIGRIEDCLNPNEPNVLVGHAFVTGGESCDSERLLSVGASGCVGAELFAPFSYTALGHLHSPSAIKHDTIKYSGSLLKYSFSEARHKKCISIIEVDEAGSFTHRTRALAPKRDMRELTGYLAELLDPSYFEKQKCDDYLKVTLLDEGSLIDPIGKLRQVYPNVLHLEKRMDLLDQKRKLAFSIGESRQKKSELDLFEQFYQEMTSSEFTGEKRSIMAEVIDTAVKEEVPV